MCGLRRPAFAQINISPEACRLEFAMAAEREPARYRQASERPNTVAAATQHDLDSTVAVRQIILGQPQGHPQRGFRSLAQG